MERLVSNKISIPIVLLALSLGIAYLTSVGGELIPVAVISVSVGAVFIALLFRNPIWGLYLTLSFSFLIMLITREISPRVQVGLGVEILLILTWIVAFFNKIKANWKAANSDVTALVILWFIISVFEIVNPSAPNVMGWFYEVRTTALNLLLIIPLTMILFNKERHLDVFLKIIIAFSLVAALNGIKQLMGGMLPGEMAFLKANTGTHFINGKLRVFSFFTDAGQFGASQAHVALICFILSAAPITLWKRAVLVAIGVVLCYGMLISGTRGALFVFAGVLIGLFLTKKFKLLFLGVMMMIGLVAFLKFTTIGQGNYHIRRLRTAVNPEQDASYIVRLNSQERLRTYLAARPFGGGLGTIGGNGQEFNPNGFLATVEPDSYWVKVWAMYGIVGLVIWFGIMMYIMGKCCGIIWNIRDPVLRIKLVALVSGTIGIFIASYGNEVINRTPSSIIVYMSWAIIFVASKWDKPDVLEAKEEKRPSAVYLN
ncbi:O-antigen ligase family protein [Parapedobacter deserti]|uniref:O-antigen ligase family protein n=1 Tax=Parapedobacter deserti TaxID=1912957 RepID=A0ABV7JJC3_9SPHI